MRSASVASLLLFLAAAARAQATIPLYSDQFDEPPFTRAGVSARWDDGGHALILMNLPRHQSLSISYVLETATPADPELCIERGRKRVPLEPEVLPRADNPKAWLIQHNIRHDEPELRLVWSMPIADLNIEALADIKTLDLRQSRTAARSAVIFCGTQGWPSHGFLVLQTENPRQRRTAITGYGFYPLENTSYARLGLLRPASGSVRDELRTGQLSQVKDKLVVMVTPDQFRKTQAIIGRWHCRGKYRLLTRDCVTMLREIALALGMEAPARGVFNTRPADYIKDLIAAN